MVGQSLRVLAGFLAVALQTLQLSIAYVMAIGRLYSVSVCYNSGAGEVASSAGSRLYILQFALSDMSTSALTGSQIDRFRSRVLLSALKLEIKGMQRRGPSAYSIIKREYGLKGSKQSVYNQLSSILDD